MKPGRVLVALLLSWLAVPSAAASSGGEPQEGLAGVLRKAGEVIVRQVSEAAVLLVDEECHQRVFSQASSRLTLLGTLPSRGTNPRRAWKAELALIPVTSGGSPSVPWLEVRDILEVDGHLLPGHGTRLAELFRPGQAMTPAQARAIVEESSRYNIGPVQRTINAPTIPLLVIHPVNQRRFTFTQTGEKKIGGVKAWKVDFVELRRPTLIQAADGSTDMPAIGTLWIDPATGDVLRAELKCGLSGETAIAVTYRRHPEYGVMVPVHMDEDVAAVGDQFVEGRCDYTRVRRFETQARLLPPKVPDRP